MKFLIYGSKGWIGEQFIKIIPSDIEYICGISRLNNISECLKEIDIVKPTHIFCFIGRTHGKINDTIYPTIDYLEQPGKLQENIRDNFESPINLAKICNEKNIHMTYLGTGCIFTYDKNHLEGEETTGFTEEDEPNFFGSSYSIVKGITDKIIKDYPNVLNLRIRMPITNKSNPRNFITKITTYEKICSIPNSMTVLPELLPKLLILAKQKYTGTLNFTNPGLISHNEILTMYRDIVDKNFTWKNFTEKEQLKILDSERSNNYLDTQKLHTLFPDIKSIKESIYDILQNYDKVPIIKNIINSKKIILVTGGCGFIGSNFINHMLDVYKDIHIINIDAMYYCANINNIKKEWINSSMYTFIKGNTKNSELIETIFEMYKPTHIINFAAQSHVDSSFNESLKYTDDNIKGTHTLLECSRLYQIKYNRLIKFIHISTDEVYGESNIDINEKGKTEQSILCPTNPYAASKCGAELLCQSYIHSFKLPIIITRGNNVYGPNQYPEKIIPKFIKQLHKGNPVTIQGDGNCLRSFLHVYDTVTALTCILKKGKNGEIYNIGSDIGSEYTVNDVADILISIIKPNDNFNDWKIYIKNRPFNDKRYFIDNKKLKSLGWNITIDFKKGLLDLISGVKI